MPTEHPDVTPGDLTALEEQLGRPLVAWSPSQPGASAGAPLLFGPPHALKTAPHSPPRFISLTPAQPPQSAALKPLGS